MSMSILEGLFWVYRIGCFIFMFLITYVLFEQYNSNDDSSKVLVKRFSEAGRNTFPIITLCLHDSGSHSLYDERYISSYTGLKVKDYRNALMGEVTGTNESILQDPMFFQTSTIKIETYMFKFQTNGVNRKYIDDWRKNNDSSINQHERHTFPLNIYYQDPNLLCYSYHAHFSDNVTVDSINYYFNISKLQMITRGEMYIYVHYINQFVRNMRYIYKVRSFDGISHHNSNNQLILDINFISIMRSRKDAIEPCDESLQNDDKKWMEKVVGIIGCFPCYWQDIFLNFTSFKRCKTPTELKKASKYLPRNNEKTTKSVLSMYTQPCDQMRVNINSNSDRYDDDTIFKIKFRFRYH